MTISVEMGVASGGRPAALDLEELLATRLLVQGNSGSGKSHLLRRLLEQSAPHVQQVVIDPEGDFVTLADAHGHVVVEGDHGEADLQRIAARVRAHRVSVVLTLENLDVEAQMRAAAAFLGGLFEAERDHWYPVLVVVDEAQLFAPAAAGEVSDEARKASLGAMTNLMCRGRKRGLAGIIATQRLAKLAKNVAAEASNFLMGRTFLDIDMARAADLLGLERRQAESFRDLERGHFIALGPALSKRPLPIAIGPVATSARSSSPKLVPLPSPAAGDSLRDLILTPAEDEVTWMPAPRPAPAPRATPTDLLQQLAQYRPPEPVEAPPSMSDAERDAALAEILREIAADPDGAHHPIAVLYQDFLVRCRMRRLPGEPLDLGRFRRRLAIARAGVDGEAAEGDEAEAVMAACAGLPEEVQGLFLLLARAARAGAPCPSDDALARAIGSRSPGRARRLLAYVESRGAAVCRTDFRGNRVVALPALGCETAPGDPKGSAQEPAQGDPKGSAREPAGLFAAE